MQKYISTILFALMVTSLLIALHQSMKYGFAQSYWLFMLTFLLMMLYQLRANKLKQSTEGTKNIIEKTKVRGNKNKK